MSWVKKAPITTYKTPPFPPCQDRKKKEKDLHPSIPFQSCHFFLLLLLSGKDVFRASNGMK